MTKTETAFRKMKAAGLAFVTTRKGQRRRLALVDPKGQVLADRMTPRQAAQVARSFTRR